MVGNIFLLVKCKNTYYSVRRSLARVFFCHRIDELCPRVGTIGGGFAFSEKPRSGANPFLRSVRQKATIFRPFDDSRTF